MIFAQWAIKWGVSAAAMHDLALHLGLEGLGAMPDDARGTSEAAAQTAVRLEAARIDGVRLYRNNVGALKDDGGRWVRFGLANDSKQMNDLIKSPDLVGWRRTLVTPDMVGTYVARTLLREVKEPGWSYVGDDHEVAQLRFLSLAIADGADAAFCTGAGTL